MLAPWRKELHWELTMRERRDSILFLPADALAHPARVSRCCRRGGSTSARLARSYSGGALVLRCCCGCGAGGIFRHTDVAADLVFAYRVDHELIGFVSAVWIENDGLVQHPILVFCTHI